MNSNFSMPLSARHLFRCLVVKANFTKYTSRFLLPLPAPRGLPSQSLTPAIYSSRNLSCHPPPLSFPHTPCAICQHVLPALSSKLTPRHSTLLLTTSTAITLRETFNKQIPFVYFFFCCLWFWYQVHSRCQDQRQGVCPLFSSGILWFQVLCLSLQSILNRFLCMM